MTSRSSTAAMLLLAVVLSSLLLLVTAHVDVHPLSKVQVQNIEHRKLDGAVCPLTPPHHIAP